MVREFQEEAGLTVQPRGLRRVLAEVTDLPERGEELHTVRIVYDVELTGGSLQAEVSDTTDEVGWYAVSEALDLQLMPFVRSVLSEG